jgi:hypothetical protein
MRHGWLVLFALLLPQDNSWIECEAELVADGKHLSPTATSVLISYLPDRAFPRMPTLSISLADTNRSLLRFDADKADKVELVLTLKPTKMPPTAAFELGAFEVTGAWDAETTWKTQPAFDPEPSATASVAPKAGEVRLDVTALAKKGLKNGLLLKVVKAVSAADVERDLRAMMAWQSMDAARQSGRPVLVFVTAEDDPNHMPVAESVLLATLAQPDVRALLEKRFANVRIAVNPGLYPDGKIGGLGIPMKDAKPPALVVTDGDGKVLRTLASIGTFDAVAFHEFLDGKPPALSKAAGLLRKGDVDGARAALKGLEDAESLYLSGCLGAEGAFKAILKKHAKSPWALKAAARLAWPERMAIYETFASEKFGATTEVATKDAKGAVERAADYLIGRQLPDGSWPVAEQADVYRAAATALAANALFSWSDAFEDERKRRANAAVARATDWLRVYVAKADPATANSWGTTYVLDYFVDRHAANKAFAGQVDKAIALHLGGQMPNGAWSYDLGFGTGWKGGFGGWPKTNKGRAHSMNTGPALVALGRAKKAGFKVDDGALQKGIEALLAMRKEAGVYTYTWPDPDSFSKLDQSIGRASGCEHALLLLGSTAAKDADVAIDAFMKYRGDLRTPVKLTAGWIPPRATSSYFFHVAYFDAARLMAERGAKEHLAKLREDLLAVVEADGAWVDFQNIGKPVATAMALMVLKLAR